MEKGENLELEKLYLTMLLHLWMNTLISLLKGIYSVQKRKKNLHAFDTCRPENLHAQKKTLHASTNVSTKMYIFYTN